MRTLPLLVFAFTLIFRLGWALEESCTCQPTTLLKDCCCSLGDVDKVHEELSPKLKALLGTTYFRYYKINLHSKCPYWNDDPVCVLKECCVKECAEDELPAKWRKEFSDVTLPDTVFRPYVQECQFSEKDFCVVENDHFEGVYVDLFQNPEAYTGYSGPSAGRIWQSIYNENCFQNNESTDNVPCTEKRIFYRLISGMHTSISSHLSAKYYDKDLDKWDFNFTSFESRIMNFPERVENLYLIYVVMLRAITKLSSYLLEYDFTTGQPEIDAVTENLIHDIATHISSCPKAFDESSLFLDTASSVKDEIKSSFRNISKIMDCVSCEKCKLWGKVQTRGIGTALKVLFSYDNPLENYDYVLQRSEIVALFNAFGKFSESLGFVKDYLKKKELEKLESTPKLLPFTLHPSVITLFEDFGFKNAEVAFALSAVTGLVLLLLVLGLSPHKQKPQKPGKK